MIKPQFKEFRIENIFNIATGRDFIIGRSLEGNIPLISHQHDNNGITKYVGRVSNRRLFDHRKTISLADRGVFWASTQNEDFYIGTRVKALTFKDGIKSERVRLYFVTAINKLQIIFKEYLTNATDNLPNLMISLPVTSTGKIDYQYMENYIQQLEKKYTQQIDSCLKTAGLDSFELTEKEQNIAERTRKGEINLKEFKIGDLFDIHPTTAYKCTNVELLKDHGKSPLISNSSMNNGIKDYINFEITEYGNIVTFSDTTTSEAIFYQPFDFVGYSHVQGMYPKKYISSWNEESYLYFITLLKKATTGRFDYATKMNRKIISDTILRFPVTSDGNIDFDYIKTYMQAQKKKAITNLIEWKNKETQTV